MGKRPLTLAPQFLPLAHFGLGCWKGGMVMGTKARFLSILGVAAIVAACG